MKKIIVLFAFSIFAQTVSAQTDSIKTFADDKFRPAAEKNGVKVSTSDMKTVVSMLNSAVNKKVNKADSLNMPSVVGRSDSSALTFKINGATGHERMKIGQNDFMYKSHTNTNRLEINQSGAALRGDTSSSFSYNLYAGVYKNIKPGATSSEGIWVDQYFFGNKGDSITGSTGNNNNGIFVGKIRKKASWMGLGTAPDSGYIAGVSGVEIMYGHSTGASEDARTGTVKGINLYPYELSGYIGNQYAIYLQTNNSNNARVTGKNYGLYMESGASGWTNVIQGSTGFGTATPQGVVDVQSTTQFAYPLPRMTTAQRNAITPQNGAMLFNTDTNKVQVYASSVWQDL